MAERELLVRIVGDDRDLQRALRNTERGVANVDQRTQSFGKNIGRAFAAAGVTLGAGTVLAGAREAVNAASDLNEQISRTEVVLGDSADAMVAWSETTASAMGISQRAALSAGATFAGLFLGVGASQEQAGEFSRVLVQLAADLASLGNSTPEEALTALRSGLAGESEPLRRYNIFLNEAVIAQQAMTETGKATAAQLTQQEKTMARYSLILQGGAIASGNYIETSGELANQQRTLRANIDNLAADFGQLLIPALESAADTANTLFLALNRLQDVDIPHFDFPEPPSWLAGLVFAPVSPLGAGAIVGTQVVKAFTDEEENLTGLDAVVDAATKAANDLVATLLRRRDALQKTLKATDVREAQEFATFVKGLGLKLDRAQLTATFNDDLAVLAELERAILREIEQEGRTFKLIEQLIAVRRERQRVMEQQAAEAEQASRDAFDAVFDALSLDVDVARASKSLRDDISTLRALEQAILDRIASEGRTTELLRQLFQVRQDQARVAQQLREQALERRQGDIFERLGLTREGEERVPGGAALRRRARSLLEQIKGTVLDTDKNRRILLGIINTTNKDFREAGRAVRQAALDLLNDISSAFDQGDKTGPLTKGSGLNTKKILEGLGLSPDQIRELRGRLSHVTTLAPSRTAGASRVPGLGVGPGIGPGLASFFVESHTTINLDGQQVASVVTKQQQKARRRNPQQKRGPNRR